MNEDIVIVGAGPTGLSLAAELYRQGHSAFVFDKQAAGENTSRACVVHARTLEVLEASGATIEVAGRRAGGANFPHPGPEQSTGHSRF